MSTKINLTRTAVAIAIAGGVTAAGHTGASAAGDFLGGSLFRDLGGIAESDSKRFATAQFTPDRQTQTDSWQVPRNPNVGPQALSIAVCSLNECSDVACEDSMLEQPRVGPEALSIAVCSLNECSDVAC
ncbi:MAG: hypothetical protein RLO50_22325 [Azospirillaceae bacterium]